MSARDETDKLLKESGAVLKRNKNHEVWELPNGRNFVRALTPSDTHSDDNNLSDLKRALGIVKESNSEGVRREKKVKQPRVEKVAYDKAVNTGLADKLRATVLENILRGEIARSEAEKGALQNRISELEYDAGHCALGRFRRWLSKK